MFSRSLPKSRVIDTFWPDIDVAVTKSLSKLGECDHACRPALAPVDPQHDMLGCGYWGCAYPTIYAGWTVKLSADPLEGPVVAAVKDDPVLRNHPGTAYIVDLWKLPKQVRWGRSPWRDVWVILREDIEPVPERRRYPQRVERAIILLDSIRNVAAKLNEHKRSSAPWKRTRDDWYRLVDEALTISETALIADFMLLFHERMNGGVLADLHYGNVGYRRHDLSDLSPGHKPTKHWVAFDLGHSSVYPEGVEIDVIKAHTQAARAANPSSIQTLPTGGW